MTDFDPLYVAARQILLDALMALEPHLHAVIVVGAHAVYIRTGDAGIAIAPFTTDADLALEPRILADRPELGRLFHEAGFEREESKPGAWVATTSIEGRDVLVPVDLMVPAAAAPTRSRRSSQPARARPHGDPTRDRPRGCPCRQRPSAHQCA
jgi:hypothetical protein